MRKGKSVFSFRAISSFLTVKNGLFCVLYGLVMLTFLGNVSAEPIKGPADFTYVVKGVVKKMPAANSKQEILVEHEAIEDYRDMDGKVVGMHSMTMPFYLTDGLVLGEIKEGDKIEMTLSQWIKPRFSEVVTKVSKISQ